MEPHKSEGQHWSGNSQENKELINAAFILGVTA